MAPDQHPTFPYDTPASLEIARGLISQRRWLDAAEFLQTALQRSPGNVALRAECAQGQLRLGNPNAALRLLTPCINQGVSSPSINGLGWRARVRAAQTSEQAAQLVGEAMSSSQPLPEFVIEEWRMITEGLLQAGWHHEAEPWLLALGTSAECLEHTSLLLQQSGPKTARPKLDLDRLRAHMVLHQQKSATQGSTSTRRSAKRGSKHCAPVGAAPGPGLRWLPAPTTTCPNAGCTGWNKSASN